MWVHGSAFAAYFPGCWLVDLETAVKRCSAQTKINPPSPKFNLYPTALCCMCWSHNFFLSLGMCKLLLSPSQKVLLQLGQQVCFPFLGKFNVDCTSPPPPPPPHTHTHPSPKREREKKKVNWPVCHNFICLLLVSLFFLFLFFPAHVFGPWNWLIVFPSRKHASSVPMHIHVEYCAVWGTMCGLMKRHSANVGILSLWDPKNA